MKKRQLLGTIVMALILLVVPLMTACAKPAPTPPSTPTPAPPKILEIGNTAPMMVQEGLQMKKWLELLAEQLNEAGGLVVKGQKYNIQVISYDDKYSADEGRACAERLVYQDKVKYILCQWSSAPIVATVAVTDPNKVLVLCDGVTEGTMNPKFNYVFRTVSMLWNNIGLTSACADVAKEKGCKTVVLINPDDETGRANSANMKQTYQKLGLTIVDELFWKRDVTDYTPFATKIKSLNAGYVDTGATPSGAPTLLLAKALYESGYTGLVFYQGLAGTWKDIISKVGPKAIEGAIGGAKDPRDYITDPNVLKLCDVYEKKYGVLETDACYIMGGWFFFVEAVKKADSLDPDAIATAMQNLEVMTLGGKSRMVPRPDLGITRTIDSVRQNALGMVKDGKFQLYKLISIDATIAATIKVMGWEQYYK